MAVADPTALILPGVRLIFEDDDPGRIIVTLSERNLLMLPTKLYTPGSLATIGIGDRPEGVSAWVTAETDNLHYRSPTREGAEAGAMIPVSESIVREVRGAVARVLAGLDNMS